MSKFARTALEKNEVNEQEWLRPPYLSTYEFSDEPLYVLPAFLSRADSSPLSQRRRDPNNVVDKNGKVIEDPSADPSVLAFECDPNLAYEKWDEYWRKVHGMRFIHKDGADDNSISKMLRYDQVHRIPGGPTSYFPPPYKVPVDENDRLYESVLGRIEPYKRPQHDGLAYMAFKTLADLQDSFSSKNKGPNSEGEQFWHPYGSTIDGVTVMAFATMNDVEDFLMTEDYAAIANHEATFINHHESEYYTCLNYNIINRLYPEVATRR